MAVQATPMEEGFHEPDRRIIETIGGGGVVEAVGGIAAVVLAIIGLVGILRDPLAAIAIIVVGAAFLSQGAALATRLSEVLHETMHSTEIGGGITTEFVGGAAGVILGVLALLGLASNVLMAVALISYGAALLLTSAETSVLNSIGRTADERMREILNTASRAAGGGQVLIGLAAVVLGILALATQGTTQITLILVGVLCVGASILFSGTTSAWRLTALYKH